MLGNSSPENLICWGKENIIISDRATGLASTGKVKVLLYLVQMRSPGLAWDAIAIQRNAI
ncbi:hypothetical protein [Nostoc sp.]|uniref:hypothetical protein n=1 Tax=Nostoc sp. TaxID=1180 RepID=UPI002FF51F43